MKLFFSFSPGDTTPNLIYLNIISVRKFKAFLFRDNELRFSNPFEKLFGTFFKNGSILRQRNQEIPFRNTSFNKKQHVFLQKYSKREREKKRDFQLTFTDISLTVFIFCTEYKMNLLNGIMEHTFNLFQRSRHGWTHDNNETANLAKSN